MRKISVAFALAFAFPTVASADLIADEEAGCRSKKEGDACSVGGGDGTCTKSTCARNDYSEGAPPKTKQVECLICQPGKPAEAAPAEDEKKADEAGADAKKDDAKKDDAKQTEAKPDGKSGMCSVGGGAPIGLGLVLLGAAAWRRRR